MNENGLRIRTLFEYAQLSDQQSYSDGKASLVSSGDQIRFSVEISSSPSVVVQSHIFFDYATFDFYGKRDSKRFELENYESKTVEFQNEGSATKRSIVLHEKPEELARYGCALESIDEFLDFIMYLRDLFGARVSSLRFEGDQAHHLARFYSIEMFRECEHVTINCGTLSNEEMRQMFKFREICISMCVPQPGFELEEPISMGHFQTHHAHWFKGPMLMQLDCETVLVSSLQLQNAHINEFLHHWMKSSNRKLRSMDLRKEYHKIEFPCEFANKWDIRKNWKEEKFDLLKITEGLSSFKEPQDQADVENRLCFKRPNDGMLVTVRVQCHLEWVSACYLWTKSC